jgi:hypothetical protein
MQNESSISVNPLNPKILIASAVDYRAESSTWVYVSSDGGITWKNFNLGKPFPTWRSSNDPSVMFDAEGVGYLVYGGFGSLESGDAGLVAKMEYSLPELLTMVRIGKLIFRLLFTPVRRL